MSSNFFNFGKQTKFNLEVSRDIELIAGNSSNRQS